MSGRRSLGTSGTCEWPSFSAERQTSQDLTLLDSVRNHGGVPDIDEDAFELEIGGLVNKPVKLSMKDLKDETKFP